MSPQRGSNSSAGCWIVILIAAVIGGLAYFGNQKPAAQSNAQMIGADPQAFKTAQDLYNFPARVALSEDEQTALLGEVDALMAEGFLPEDSHFREVLLKLDGAGDLEAVVAKVGSGLNGYKDRLDSSSTIGSDVQALFNQGNNEYLAGNFSAAEEKYLEVLRQAPNHWDARNNLGLCDLHLGNHVDAVMQFNLLYLAAPTYRGATQNLTVALERMGLSAQAYGHAKGLVSQDAKLPMAQYNLAWFESKNGNYTDAASIYRKALDLVPNYANALHAAAVNKLAKGDQPTSQELNTFSAEEKSLINAAATVPAAAAASPIVWWWWALMVLGILILVGLFFRSAVNERTNAFVWVMLTTIGLIIALIVCAIFFRNSSTFAMVLSALIGLNVLIMIPSSAPN
jgi:tetratricopeptide (TPR) repeat protein